MTPDPNPAKPATLFGGEHVVVHFRDPQLPPREIFVRELKPSEFNALLAVWHSMTETVEFVCGEPAGFGDSLVPTSLLDLHDKVSALNPSFGPWLDRQGPILAKLAPMAAGFPSSASAPGARSR